MSCRHRSRLLQSRERLPSLASRWREQDFAARPYDRTISPGLDLAFDNKQLASIGHPTLVPNPFGGVLKTETLTFQPVCAFALFPQDAAIERAINLAVARPLILAKRRAMEIVPTSNFWAIGFILRFSLSRSDSD